MSGNIDFSFDDVAVVSLVACEAPLIVTSAELDEHLEPLFARTRARAGLLKSLTGIVERRQWPEGVSFTDAAAMAGEKALDRAGIDRSGVGLLIDTSVARARLEPSSAVTVHDALGLASSCLNFDVSNACLGFLNGMHLAGVMIDSGQVDYALVVDGEGNRELQQSTIARLTDPDAELGDLFSNFASLTLGSGSAAVVMGRHSENPGGHKVVRGFFRSDTSYHDLCVGSLEYMRTDAVGLLDGGVDLAKAAWGDADKSEWLDARCYILHQVSRVHTTAMVDVLGIDPDRVPVTYPLYGNIGPVSIPFTLTTVEDSLVTGDQVLCIGIGSGLNVAVLEILW
jgi:3-oxoacyl-[acyl-carrier-protein] synthase III